MVVFSKQKWPHGRRGGAHQGGHRHQREDGAWEFVARGSSVREGGGRQMPP